MAHFTQLGLSGSPEGKPLAKGAKPADRQTRENRFGRVTSFMGWMLVTSVVGVGLLQAGGCARNRKPIAIKSDDSETKQALVQQPTPAMATSVTYSQAPAVKKTRKSSRQHKLSAATYSNPLYGISFEYPKKASLKEGDSANLQWAELGPVEMNYVETGGATIAAVELPQNLYPSSDFTGAFFNVSVNPKLTQAQCEQFAFPQSDDSISEGKNSSQVELSAVKLGSTELKEVEESGRTDSQQADAKYYHLYQNGMCYEFVLGLETTADGGANGKAAVDRNEIFRKLNWMLSTVKIVPAGVAQPVAEQPAHEPGFLAQGK